MNPHLLACHAQTEAAAQVGVHVQFVLLLELLGKVRERHVVQVSAAQVAVPCVREHAQLALIEGHDGDLQVSEHTHGYRCCRFAACPGSRLRHHI